MTTLKFDSKLGAAAAAALVADGPSGTFPRALRDAAACARTTLRGMT